MKVYSMTVEDEQKIIKNVLDGDKDAFEDLLLANQKNMFNLALKMTGNEEDALDISQEAFFKAYRRLGSFRGDSRFSVWLYRLTYNLCIDFLRTRPRTGAVSLSYQDDDDELVEFEIVDVRNLPEDSILQNELRETISESIDELNPRYREIILMREITGMSYNDMAETLELSEGTVKSRLARARMSLASILARKGTFPADFRHTVIPEEVGQRE